DTKTYSLTDTAGGRFAINASTGVITVADGSLLNYEAASSHNLTVQVTDSGGQSYTEQFTINLTNVNEGPTDLSLSTNSVAENAATGTVVGTVTGTDPDAGDTKSYSLTDTAGGRFAINASTGVITVADGSLLNYESAASHTITVQVTDAGGITHDQTFTINLTNVNEASPEVDGGDGGEQTLVASLFQKSPAGSEAVQPFILSQPTGGDSESKSESVEDLRKPVEWDAQAVPPVDILNSGRNVLDLAHGGDENHVGGAGTKGKASTSSGQQDEIAGNLESTNAAPSDPGQVSWPSAGETEQIRDDSEGFAKTMVAGLVGAALQGTVRKKERMTTMHDELPSDDQKAANESASREPIPDDGEIPPRAA
ncbi:MAG: cadherin repeat domain-containing protein, partial [Nitrospira sp.]|nr:cadherin repeat domain-containing protein [Nitrospira sp.]